MGNLDISAKDRLSAVLTPSQLPCLSRVPTVNLTSGCAHGCLYCYSRSYSQFPGENKVVIYGNTLEKLREEIRRRKVKPAFVYFSPSTDVFQPVEAVLKLAYATFDFLLTEKVGVAFVTKGTIPSAHLKLFAEYPTQIRAQIGLISLDSSVLNVFEPGCASVSVRLRQIEQLLCMGVETEVRVDPIVPGVTDDSETLTCLFSTLKTLGVKKIALNILYLRAALFKTLRERISDKSVAEKVIDRYVPGMKIRVCDGKFTQIALPKSQREEIFGRAIRIANQCGISCHCCGCMNPDISNGNCNLTGEWQVRNEISQQLDLL